MLKHRLFWYLSGIGFLTLFFIMFWALYPEPIGILQGATDDTSTQFSVVSALPDLECIVYEGDSKENPIAASKKEVVEKAESPFKVVKCFFENLESSKQYRLEITDKEKNRVDSREFGLLPVKPEGLTLGIVSCTSDLTHIPLIWSSFFSHKPDLLLMIGDNVYADTLKPIADLTETHLWNRYARTFRVLKLFQNRKLIPVLAIWDDHDFGVNNGNGTFKNKDFSKFLLDSYFAQSFPNSRIKKGPAASFIYEYGNTNFIFLDGRYFRAVPTDNTGSYFSNEQTEWVTAELKNRPGVTNWIISGNQWFGSKHSEENFENEQPEGLKNFLSSVNSTEAKYLLISGDSHFSEIKKVSFLEKAVFEITSSAMHAWPPGLIFADDRRVVVPTNFPNFTLATFRNDKPNEIEFGNFGVFNNLHYEIKINLTNQ